MEPAPFPLRLAAYVADLFIVSVALGVISIAGGVFLGSVLGSSGSPFLLDPDNPMGFRYDPTAMAPGTLALALAGFAAVLLAMIAVYHGYFVWYESRKNGQTPGKRWFGIRVVDAESGAPPSPRQAFWRDFMRYIDVGLVFPGLLAILLDRAQARRMGDRVAHTRVIRDLAAPAAPR